MVKPNSHIQCVVRNQRLVYYWNAPDVNFWDNHWRQHCTRHAYDWAEQGQLGCLEPVAHWLPQRGHIIEAGCGTGQNVLALRVRGYDAEGVEWAPETVRAVRELIPDLPIRVEDLNHLEVPDGYYKAYISLGVVEHSPQGPHNLLREAYRVIAPGGIAIISVPYFHVLRKLKARMGLYSGDSGGLEFYQYAFSESEFREILASVGFQVVDQEAYDGYKGVKDEIPLVRRILKWRWIGCRLTRLMKIWKWGERNLGHMMLYVCRKAF